MHINFGVYYNTTSSRISYSLDYKLFLRLLTPTSRCMALPLELSYMLMMYYYTPVNTIVDCQSLQEDLDRLVQWADRWQMNFNFTKCEMIRITNRINPVYYTYRMKDHCLNEVSHTKYLGVFIDKGLTWSKHTGRLYYI